MSRRVASLPGGWPEDSPARSAFFGLSPEGVDGASYESLSSYYRRLSARHGILPWSLAYRAVCPLFENLTVKDLKKAAATCYEQSINGVADIAQMWVESLEKLTLRNDLELHTLLPLRALIAPYMLISKREQFCSECYKDDNRIGRPIYNRLLWSLACVEACPIHKTRLIIAPASSGNSSEFWLPGISRFDGTRLSDAATSSATAEQLKGAALVAQLLDDVRHHPTIFDGSKASCRFLQYLSDTLFNGKAAHLAKHLGVSKGQLYDWMSGGIHPSLPYLLRIANRCGCSLADVLLGNKILLRSVAPDTISITNISSKRTALCRTSDDLLCDLKNLIASGSVQDLADAAKQLNTSSTHLRKIAPELTTLLVQQGKEARHAQSIKRKASRFDRFFQAFVEESCAHPGRRATRRMVTRRLRVKYGLALDFVEAAAFLKRAQSIVDASA